MKYKVITILSENELASYMKAITPVTSNFTITEEQETGEEMDIPVSSKPSIKKPAKPVETAKKTRVKKNHRVKNFGSIVASFKEKPTIRDIFLKLSRTYPNGVHAAQAQMVADYFGFAAGTAARVAYMLTEDGAMDKVGASMFIPKKMA